VKLDAPGGVSDPEGLEPYGIAGERHRTRRELEGVAVPLEGREPAREVTENRVLGALGRQLDLVPADLIVRRAPHPSACGLRDQLTTEAHPE
jgi:hypothetical protein